MIKRRVMIEFLLVVSHIRDDTKEDSIVIHFSFVQLTSIPFVCPSPNE